MIYSTIRPQHCVIKKISALPKELFDVAKAVEGMEKDVTATHALVSEAGAVYAYGEEGELKQLQVALGAVIETLSV